MSNRGLKSDPDLMKMVESKRFIVTLPQGLQRAMRMAAEYRGCSQSEVVRAALYEHLKDFVSEDSGQVSSFRSKIVEKFKSIGGEKK